MSVTTYTRPQALVEMRESARALVAPEFAESIAAAFGESLESLGLKPKALKNFNRASYLDEDADLPTIAVESIALCIVLRQLGKDAEREAIAASNRYNGRGMVAQAIVDRAVQLLAFPNTVGRVTSHGA